MVIIMSYEIDFGHYIIFLYYYYYNSNIAKYLRIEQFNILYTRVLQSLKCHTKLSGYSIILNYTNLILILSHLI